ncbi:MAG TPA: cation diffusion facilitator family transporter [Gaiellales bacterium]|jgi:cation diffusion facilitator family transporter
MIGSPSQPRLQRLLWLSVGAALATIALKTAAWLVTDSVGLLSDAAESLVNLVAAIVALATLHFATQPPDPQHRYGHEKAEYFSAGLEGGMILLAALSIGWLALERLLHPAPLREVGVGVVVSAFASAVNFAVGLKLVRVGRVHRSVVLEADGRHLLTDVWTSVGVIAGVVVVAATGVERLDPIIALVVAANIVLTGAGLVRRSIDGLMDRSLPPEAQKSIGLVLDRYAGEQVSFHALRTRQSGRRSFISLHVLVPGSWSVHAGHSLLEQLERDLRAAVPGSTVFTHLEPLEDPESFEDTALERWTAVDRSEERDAG